MGHPAALRRSVVACSLVFVLGGCATVEPSPVATADDRSTTSAPVVSIDPADLARWIAFRQTYGLRSDVAWVTRVADDPTSANDLDIPLLPAEIDVVAGQNLAIEAVMPAVIAYGQGFDDFAGAIIDGPHGVILFRDDLAEHQAAVDGVFGPGRIEVRAAPYAIADLERLGATVMAERAWFDSLGVELIDADPDELTNSVEVRYIAPDRSAEPTIREHFGDPDWMTIRWLGPPAWTGPLGRLVVRIVDPGGHPLPGAADPTCTPIQRDPSVRYAALPKGTKGTDSCVFDDVPAVAYDVEIRYIDANDNDAMVTTLVVVPPGGTGSRTVVIDR